MGKLDGRKFYMTVKGGLAHVGIVSEEVYAKLQAGDVAPDDLFHFHDMSDMAARRATHITGSRKDFSRLEAYIVKEGGEVISGESFFIPYSDETDKKRYGLYMDKEARGYYHMIDLLELFVETFGASREDIYNS